MGSRSILNRLLAAVAVAGLSVYALKTAGAAELRMGRSSVFSPAPALSSSTLTIGYLTPAYGSLTLGISPSAPLLVQTLTGTASALSLAPDSANSYPTALSIGRVGVFGAYDERPSVLALAPAATWNFGAAVGYAGFYVRGGVNEAASVGPLLGIQGLEAGFGYEIGSLDLRVTYLTSQGVGLDEHGIDTKQWAIGGIYQISPRIRLNADAFYGVGESRGTSLAVLPPVNSPPGTGARVGVNLRF